MNARKLLLTLAVLSLPIGACHRNDRDDSYRDTSYRNDTTYRDNTTYRSDNRDAVTHTDTRYDPNYRADHAEYDRTDHANRNDKGNGATGTVTFNRLTGNMSTTIDAGMDRAQQAAEKALADLHYVITEKKMEDNKSVIEAKSADKDKVKVTLERNTDRMTDVTIGVGMTGKQSNADLVLEKMQEFMK